MTARAVGGTQAEVIADTAADLARKLGADIVGVVVRVPGGAGNCALVLAAADKKQAARLFIETANQIAASVAAGEL